MQAWYWTNLPWPELLVCCVCGSAGLPLCLSVSPPPPCIIQVTLVCVIPACRIDVSNHLCI